MNYCLHNLSHLSHLSLLHPLFLALRVVATLSKTGQYPFDSLAAVITASGVDNRAGVK